MNNSKIKKNTRNYENRLINIIKQYQPIYLEIDLNNLDKENFNEILRNTVLDILDKRLNERLKKARMNVYKSQITSDCFCCFNLKKN